MLAALYRYRGALLADPVGSGKTFVALATAQAMNRGPTVCIVPAALQQQWRAAANRLSLPIVLCSHEQISRGRMPARTSGLVLIDESHHYRNPRTRRYRNLAPWLVGRRTLLVTATPVVNHLLDLAHQLLLAVRDDALAWDGIASLRSMLAAGCTASALGQLVIEGESAAGRRPEKACDTIDPAPGSCTALAQAIELVDKLQLSTSDPIAALIRGTLLRALSSSPAAFLAALRRYRRLLHHARDALQAGQVLDRAELRRFTKDLGDQLVWWELLPGVAMESELALGDLEGIAELIKLAEDLLEASDPKLGRLHVLLSDGLPTLVFTTSRDTVQYIRVRLSDLRPAWCTGTRAGIGTATLPRDSVLEAFQQPPDPVLAPRHLIVTDVAAEGLNLQRAARVVHYDLPWTPMRLHQREGRSARYGSRYSRIDVVRFSLPAILERRLKVEVALRRKAGLPGMAGLGPAGSHLWRWRGELAARYESFAGRPGVAVILDSAPGLLAGFALAAPGERIPLATAVLWLEPDGFWTDAPDKISEKLATATAQAGIIVAGPTVLSEWLKRLAVPIRKRLAQVKGRRWIMPDQPPAVRQLVTRLQQMIREAARLREARRLAELEEVLGSVAGGHTAGEIALVEQLTAASDSELLHRLHSLPPRALSCDHLEVWLTGMVLFGPPHQTLKGVASLECGSTPPSSISTEP